MGFKKIKLKEVLEQYKKLITLSSDTEYKQITIKMYGKGVVLRGIQKGFDIQTKNQYLIKKGQFIISKIDARNGAFGKIPDDLDGSIISNSFASFNINTNLLNIDFLILISKTYDFVNACIGKSEGTTNRQSVKIDNFLELEIPLPSLQEQEKIVKKLESINRKIEKIKSAKEKNNIKILREQILKQAIEGKLTSITPPLIPPQGGGQTSDSEFGGSNSEFGGSDASILLENIKKEKEKMIKEGKLKKEKELPKIKESEIPFEIPKNWVWCRLGEIGNKGNSSIVDGPFGSAINTNQDYIEKGIPIIRMLNIKPNYFIQNNLKYISEEKFKTLERHNILANDVLFSKVGAGIGECCIVPSNFIIGLVSTTGVSRFRVGEIVINKFLLYFLLQHKDSFVNIASSSAQPFLNMTTLKNTLFPLPPLEEQKRIVEKLEYFEEKLNKLDKLQTKQLVELEILKNAILEKALSGELM